MTFPDGFVPQRAIDTVVRRIAGEAVIWASNGPGPVRLDQVATTVFDIVDGSATIEELVQDVHNVVGVSREDARFHIQRSLADLAGAGALQEIPGRAGPALDYFPFPPST